MNLKEIKKETNKKRIKSFYLFLTLNFTSIKVYLIFEKVIQEKN